MRATRGLFVWTGCVAVIPIAAGLAKGEGFGLFVLVCLLAATIVFRLSDVLEFSLGPLSAKMRETVREADELLGRLKSLALLSADGVLTASMSTGRFADKDRNWQLELREKVRGELKALGCTDGDIERVEKRWRQLAAVDYQHVILGGNLVPSIKEHAVRAKWTSLRNRNPLPLPQEIREFLEENDWLTDENRLWLDAYERFLRTGDVDSAHNPFDHHDSRALGA